MKERNFGVAAVVTATVLLLGLLVYDINYGPILPTNDSKLSDLGKLVVKKLEEGKRQ